jgi:hypothetical protein
VVMGQQFPEAESSTQSAAEVSWGLATPALAVGGGRSGTQSGHWEVQDSTHCLQDSTHCWFLIEVEGLLPKMLGAWVFWVLELFRFLGSGMVNLREFSSLLKWKQWCYLPVSLADSRIIHITA